MTSCTQIYSMYFGRHTVKMYLFFRQMPIAVGVLQLLVHCFSQIFQSKGDRICTLDYHKGALGSYICNKTLGDQEGGAALHF